MSTPNKYAANPPLVPCAIEMRRPELRERKRWKRRWLEAEVHDRRSERKRWKRRAHPTFALEPSAAFMARVDASMRRAKRFRAQQKAIMG